MQKIDLHCVASYFGAGKNPVRRQRKQYKPQAYGGAEAKEPQQETLFPGKPQGGKAVCAVQKGCRPVLQEPAYGNQSQIKPCQDHEKPLPEGRRLPQSFRQKCSHQNVGEEQKSPGQGHPSAEGQRTAGQCDQKADDRQEQLERGQMNKAVAAQHQKTPQAQA